MASRFVEKASLSPETQLALCLPFLWRKKKKDKHTTMNEALFISRLLASKPIMQLKKLFRWEVKRLQNTNMESPVVGGWSTGRQCHFECVWQFSWLNSIGQYMNVSIMIIRCVSICFTSGIVAVLDGNKNVVTEYCPNEFLVPLVFCVFDP